MIERFHDWRRIVAVPLVVSVAALSAPLAPARAGMVGTDQVIEQREGANRERIADFLARDDVRAEIQALGLSPDEARARVAALSDEEVRTIADRMDALPAGQGAIGAIVGAALIVFLVLLITDLMGLTDVFSFTKKGAIKSH